MLKEDYILNKITEIALSDANIRTALLYGSRAQGIEGDEFQDYDVYYIVYSPRSFNETYGDMTMFGKTSLTWRPDLYSPESFRGRLMYLMLLGDGNRIDLSVSKEDVFLEKFPQNPETPRMKVLFDRTTGNSYGGEAGSSPLIKKPSKEDFFAVCDAFLWEQQNAAKLLARQNIAGALHIRETNIRATLDRMIDWHIGLNSDFSVSAGRLGCMRRSYLEKPLLEKLYATFTDAKPVSVRLSLLEMLRIFDELAKEVSDGLDFGYTSEKAVYVRRYYIGIFG